MPRNFKRDYPRIPGHGGGGTNTGTKRQRPPVGTAGHHGEPFGGHGSKMVQITPMGPKGTRFVWREQVGPKRGKGRRGRTSGGARPRSVRKTGRVR